MLSLRELRKSFLNISRDFEEYPMLKDQLIIVIADILHRERVFFGEAYKANKRKANIIVNLLFGGKKNGR